MNLLIKLVHVGWVNTLFFERKELRIRLLAETLARVDAEAALHIRTDLMKALAHELRAPLTPIVAELALLELEPHAAECVASLRAIRKHVEEQAETIARLLDRHEVPEHKDEEDDQPLSGARPRLLLVEDHEPTRYTLKQLLWRYGFKVQGVASVADAVAHARPEDFVVCDIGLPDGSGYDVMQQLRHLNVRGIAVSGYGTEEDRRKSIDAGFAAHLTKPLDIRQLLTAIATHASPTARPPVTPRHDVAA